MSKPFPGVDVPVVNPQTGLMNQTWYEYFSQHHKLSQLPDVSTTAPTNNQVLIWNSTTLLWTPGTN
jgi:hypothetical protein